MENQESHTLRIWGDLQRLPNPTPLLYELDPEILGNEQLDRMGEKLHLSSSHAACVSGFSKKDRENMIEQSRLHHF